MKHKHDELYKSNQRQKHEQQKNQLRKFFIGNLSVNVTIDDIYEFFGLKHLGKHQNICPLIPALKCIKSR